MPDRNLVNLVRQSSPVDTTAPYDPSTLKGKTIIITGGASGFGEGFSRLWASHGANIIVADVSDKDGEALIAQLRATTKNDKHHYVHCDVTNWQSQVDLFHAAVKFSPHGGIDGVVANAGITDGLPPFDTPVGLDAPTPPKPNWKCFEVNMIGVMYTAHLAAFYLPRNPDSKAAGKGGERDRHLLLIGSMASLSPIPGQIQYAISKHGVLGLFRSLRSTAFMNGLRVNLLCPYFIKTPIIPAGARALLAGGAMGEPEDVVDAGTRLMADRSIVGRALVIGPKVRVDGDSKLELVPQTDANGKELAVWEAYAHDFEEGDAFMARFIKLLNSVERVRGFFGILKDLLGAFWYPFKTGFRGKIV